MTFWHCCCLALFLPVIPGFITTVDQGTRLEHHDVRGTLTVLNPGLHFRTPILENFGQTIQMRDTVVTLPRLTILSSDGISFTITDALLVFRVTNPAHYSLHANHANASFPKIAEGVLSTVLRSMTSGEILPGASNMRVDDLANKQQSLKVQIEGDMHSDSKTETGFNDRPVAHIPVLKQQKQHLLDVFEKAKKEFRSYEESWGVHVVSIQLTSLEPTNRHEFSQVQLNALRIVAQTRADMQTLEYEAHAKQIEAIIHANTEKERALINAQARVEVAKLTLETVQALESNPLAQQLTLLSAGERLVGASNKSTIVLPLNPAISHSLAGELGVRDGAK